MVTTDAAGYTYAKNYAGPDQINPSGFIAMDSAKLIKAWQWEANP